MSQKVKINGKEGVSIPKNWIVLLSFMLIFLTTMASVVAYSVGVSKTASEALQEARECKKEINNNEDQIDQNKEDIAVTESQYDDIIRRLESIEEKIDAK